MKLPELISTVEALSPSLPIERIIVSVEYWEELRRTCAPRSLGIADVSIADVPVILSRYFKPDWWAEDYTDRTILHHADGQITIPKVRKVYDRP